MASLSGGSGVVGFFRIRHINRDSTKDLIVNVCANDEFDIGRGDILRGWGITEKAVSAHHLRVRCIVYDEDWEKHLVAPMVCIRILSTNPARLTHTDVDGATTVCSIAERDGDIFLSSGDRLQLTSTISVEFCERHNQNSRRKAFSDEQKAEMRLFGHKFAVSDRVLGVGGQASVFVALKQSSRKQVACKIVPLQTDCTQRINPDAGGQRKYLAREFNILRSLKHPNIVKLDMVIQGSHNIYILQELITGGDLLSYIDRKGALNEPQTIAIIRQVLEGVHYLHSSHVVHRDIKPENILLTSWRDGARVVLSDFGQARFISGDSSAAADATVFRMQSIVGTYGYTAPEVIRLCTDRIPTTSGYGKAVDMWSVGCVTAVVLTNDTLFGAHNHSCSMTIHEKHSDDSEDPWDLSVLEGGGRWAEIGRNAKAFVRSCLEINERDRMTADMALNHRWIKHPNYKTEADNAYARAIRNWEPPETGRPDVLERLETAKDSGSSRPDGVQTDTGVASSHYFNPHSIAGNHEF